MAAVADYNGNDPDLVQVKEFIARGALAPFFPRYEGDYRLTKAENVAATKHYVEALKMRTITHEMLGIPRSEIIESISGSLVNTYHDMVIDGNCMIHN